MSGFLLDSVLISWPEEISALRSVGGVINQRIFTGIYGICSTVTLPLKVNCTCERDGTLWTSKICSCILEDF